MAPPAVIFDLDGTIWDSTPWFAKLISREAGADTDQLRAALVGGSSIVTMINNCKISRTRFMTLARWSISELDLYPGVEQSLLELTDRHIPMAVFTSLPGSIAVPLLAELGLEKFFSMTVHAGNCLSRKPNPTGIHKALDHLGIVHSLDSFYVGDREIDSQTAKNAGVSFAWASYGYQSTEPGYVTVRLKSPYDLADL